MNAQVSRASQSDGSNILEGYCVLCRVPITQKDVQENKAAPIPTPSGKEGWACTCHKGV